MDEQKPLVSVLMSVRNGSEWLRTAIESVIAQTYRNWEFIIIDDASDKDTLAILKEYETREGFKIYYRNEQHGLTRNLNYALQFAIGKYIARLDADDIAMPERFMKQVNYLETHPGTDVLATYVDFIDEEGNSKGIWNDDRTNSTASQIRAALPLKCCLAHPSVMMRKEVLMRYQYNENQVHSQDWDLWLRMSAGKRVIEKLTEPLLKYRLHQRSVTVISNKRSAFRKIDEVYRAYLSYAWHEKNFGFFNMKVFACFLFNKVKLFLSRIKRAFTS